MPDFDSETTQLLRELGTTDYAVLLKRINDLEERYTINAPEQTAFAIRVSCADLRLDAALIASRPSSECEELYRTWLNTGVDAQTQLMKSIILAKEVSGDRDGVVHRHVVSALKRARAEGGVPNRLFTEAERLVEKEK